jgi:hypothetical protein
MGIEPPRKLPLFSIVNYLTYGHNWLQSVTNAYDLPTEAMRSGRQFSVNTAHPIFRSRAGWIMPERQLQNLSAPNELGAARLPRPADPRLRRCSPTGSIGRRCGCARPLRREAAARNFKGAHSNIARLVNGFAVDAWALDSDLTALISA